MTRPIFISLALLAVVATTSPAQDKSPAKEEGSMLTSVETTKSLAALREDVPKACAAHKFGVLSVVDLKEKMKEKGVDYAGECLIFEVCNPQKAKTALEATPEISTVLPCRISAFKGKDGKMRLSTIRPSRLLDLFGTAELKPVAADVEAALTAIMSEAAR